VAVLGVRPVDPAVNDVTPPDEIDAVVTDVKMPLASTVITGTAVVEP
jgi:translation initiation factor 2B subunit (eIF-2B alpha/beta/delta family)